MRHGLSVVAALLVAANAPAQQPPAQPAFTFQEVMIPVRDGVPREPAIPTPTDKPGPLPILFRRTPYGVPDQPLPRVPPSWQALAQDGYIFVIQTLRGRFKSEGVFRLTSQVDLTDSTSANETTDAYDSIDWLVKHVPNNGNVGMFGVSYDGLTTALALLHPHPALKAMSEQAAPVDQWMNDDMHRYGALRESYAFEYSVLEQADKNKNTNFAFETYDTYAWYLALGPLSNIDARYLHGSISFWTEVLRRVLDGERRNDMSKPPDVDRQPQPDYPSQGVRMFTRWSLRVGLACSLACSPLVLAGQEKSLPQQIADQLVLLAGGIHTGYRFNHAKGLVVTGTFTAAAGAPSVSRAAHLKGGTVPVTVRVSDARGVPNIPDTDPGAVPRGIAIRFALSGGAFTDIVAVSHNGFVVGTGEDFLAFLKAIAATRPDSPHPSPVEAFLGSHPRALKFVLDNKPLPASFATLAYFGNNAFVFVDAKGTKRPGRYQIIPVAGLSSLDSAAASKAGPNYLFDELPQRLAQGPVQFRLYVQLANPGDQTKDGSMVWPDDRQRVELGTISLTAVAPKNDELQRSLMFSPIYLTAGIELSDDPLVPLRAAVYALSVAHRH